MAITRKLVNEAFGGPPIILLLEETAALDTESEQHIQEALDGLVQGRTMLVIVRRLSTTTRTDQILVLHEGQVVERGTHDEPLFPTFNSAKARSPSTAKGGPGRDFEIVFQYVVGTHDELLGRKGRYATMWRKQVKAQEAAQKAKALNDKADRLGSICDRCSR
jgi:ABC-type multidrug transport system ATPase subunit